MLLILRTFKEQIVNLTLPLRKSMHRYCAPDDSGGRETMPYTPQHIANYFIKRAGDEGISITPLKLIKLVYIAYGWYIALTNEKLFNEPIEAWEHGPVIPTIYHEFKHFKKSAVTDLAEDYDANMEESYIPEVSESDTDTVLVLSKVWAAYKRFSAWALRNKTHETDGPWDKVYDRHRRDVVLNDNDIKAHYIVKIRQYIDAAKSRTAA